MDAARLGPELEVSAWPEPPSVKLAERFAGRTAGATATERALAADPSRRTGTKAPDACCLGGPMIGRHTSALPKPAAVHRQAAGLLPKAITPFWATKRSARVIDGD